MIFNDDVIAKIVRVSFSQAGKGFIIILLTLGLWLTSIVTVSVDEQTPLLYVTVNIVSENNENPLINCGLEILELTKKLDGFHWIFDEDNEFNDWDVKLLGCPP